MKRFSTLLLAGLLGASTAQAQLGVKAGLNAAAIDGQNISASTEFRTTPHVGVFYEAKVLGPLSVQPEVQYSLQGGRFKSDLADFKTNLHYLNVPVVAKVRFARAYVEAGPQLGLLLKAREDGRVMTGQDQDGFLFADGNRGAWNRYKKADFAFVAGAGFKLLAGLSVGARFVAGLSDVNEVSTLTGPNDERLKNRVFQGFVTFQLP